MQSERERLTAFLDRAPARTDLLPEVLEGLRSAPKRLPCKFFYDELGSRLFDRICEQPEYYPTRTELAILREHGAAMARAIGPRALLIEYGSGSSTKTRVLLDQLDAPAGYLPIDISREHLRASAEQIAADYPALRVAALCADYTNEIDLPDLGFGERRRVVFFPGSTIGNFEPEDVTPFLRRIHAACRAGGGLLIGVDLKKDKAVLEAAYDDAAGVTAAFNRNALVHVNRQLGADFDAEAFQHLARYDEVRGRVEIHLVSQKAQVVHIGGAAISFAEGERLHTENSHKYTVEEFRAVAARAGFVAEQTWTDAARRFSVHFLRAT